MANLYVRPDRSVDRFDADPISSFTMAADLYTDPNVAELERRKIFSNSWQWVGHRSDVAEPGQYFTTEVAGERIFVVRDMAGDLRAFFNVCLHRGHSLLTGAGRLSGPIVCPYLSLIHI